MEYVLAIVDAALEQEGEEPAQDPSQPATSKS